MIVAPEICITKNIRVKISSGSIPLVEIPHNDHNTANPTSPPHSLRPPLRVLRNRPVIAQGIHHVTQLARSSAERAAVGGGDSEREQVWWPLNYGERFICRAGHGQLNYVVTSCASSWVRIVIDA